MARDLQVHCFVVLPHTQIECPALEPARARSLIERLFRDHPTKRFSVRLWDGSEVRWQSAPEITVVFRDPDAFFHALRTGDPSVFAEAYVTGRIDIEGDVSGALDLARYLGSVELGIHEKLRFARELSVPPSRHTPRDDRRDVRAHYDLPKRFFELFLDEKLVYSCAYFLHPEQSLEKAQEQKLELVCRKLDLQPGERLLDVGCGWGALPCWAANQHGVSVHGITLSKLQVEEARRRAAGRRVTIEERHYEELSEAYDKVSSVGMYEHVGVVKLPAYFAAVYRALEPGGLFLNHGISSPPSAPGRVGGEFMWRHVFPGAEIPELCAVVTMLEQAGFEILDVQSLRPHYALTLREWARRFRAHRAQAARLVPEEILRTWDLYLAGCAQVFDEGVVGIHQLLAAKPDALGRHRAPPTREKMLLV